MLARSSTSRSAARAGSSKRFEAALPHDLPDMRMVSLTIRS